jgi:hypothetical protein
MISYDGATIMSLVTFISIFLDLRVIGGRVSIACRSS